MKRRAKSQDVEESAILDRPTTTEAAAAGPPPSYETQTLGELCVRVNSIMYCMDNIDKMSQELATELGQEVRFFLSPFSMS
jgi:hypothetical protein